MRLLLLLATSLVISLGNTARGICQEQANVATQREAMKKLEVWVGEWKGPGWFRVGANEKRDFTNHETIEWRLGGLALVVEGKGKTRNPTTGVETDTHNALGVVSYDDKTKRYRFWNYRAGEAPSEDELKLADGGFYWERRLPRGFLKFTLKFEGDTWRETGEFSNDGKTWTPIMDMTLTRQKSVAGPKKP